MTREEMAHIIARLAEVAPVDRGDPVPPTPDVIYSSEWLEQAKQIIQKFEETYGVTRSYASAKQELAALKAVPASMRHYRFERPAHYGALPDQLTYVSDMTYFAARMVLIKEEIVGDDVEELVVDTTSDNAFVTSMQDFFTSLPFPVNEMWLFDYGAIEEITTWIPLQYLGVGIWDEDGFDPDTWREPYAFMATLILASEGATYYDYDTHKQLPYTGYLFDHYGLEVPGDLGLEGIREYVDFLRHPRVARQLKVLEGPYDSLAMFIRYCLGDTGLMWLDYSNQEVYAYWGNEIEWTKEDYESVRNAWVNEVEPVWEQIKAFTAWFSGPAENGTISTEKRKRRIDDFITVVDRTLLMHLDILPIQSLTETPPGQKPLPLNYDDEEEESEPLEEAVC